MNTKEASLLFEALSSQVRLDIFKLLVKHAPEGLVASEISSLLDIAPSNLSFHFKTLLHIGLVEAEQQGRFQRYKANILKMLDIVAFLTDQCCANDKEACLNYRKNSTLEEFFKNKS